MLSMVYTLKILKPLSDSRSKLSLPLDTRKVFHQKNFCKDAVNRLQESFFSEKVPPKIKVRKCQKKYWVCSRGELDATPFFFIPSSSQPGLCIGDCFHYCHTSLQYQWRKSNVIVTSWHFPVSNVHLTCRLFSFTLIMPLSATWTDHASACSWMDSGLLIV